MGVSFTTLALSTLSCFLPLLRSALCGIAPRVALSHERSPVHSTEPLSFTGDSSTNFYERSLCPGAVPRDLGVLFRALHDAQTGFAQTSSADHASGNRLPTPPTHSQSLSLPHRN